MPGVHQGLDRPGADINHREIALGPVVGAGCRNVGKDDGLAVGRPVETWSRVTMDTQVTRREPLWFWLARFLPYVDDIQAVLLEPLVDNAGVILLLDLFL